MNNLSLTQEKRRKEKSPILLLFKGLAGAQMKLTYLLGLYVGLDGE